jgi:N-acetylglutamate synthase/N-acetylornithine aminotransferase
MVARTITSSPLVKTAIHGSVPTGPNNSSCRTERSEMVENKVALDIAGIPVVREGEPLPFDKNN